MSKKLKAILLLVGVFLGGSALFAVDVPKTVIPEVSLLDSVYVSASAEDEGTGIITSPVKTIVAAMALVKDGGKINVGAGTFAQDAIITISKDITISGVDSVKTIIKGNATSTTQHGFLIPTAKNVTFENLRITEVGGSTTEGAKAIFAGTRENGKAFDGATLTVKNCTLDSFGKNGIECQGGTLIATGNFIDVRSVVGSTANKNGISVGSLCNATITGNKIVNSATAHQDFDASGVYTCWGAKTVVTGNTFENHYKAIAQDVRFDVQDQIADQANWASFVDGTLNEDAETTNTFTKCERPVFRSKFAAPELNTLYVTAVNTKGEGFYGADGVYNYFAPVAEGASPYKFNTIADAVTAAKAGDTIVIGEGTFPQTAVITIDTSLTIVGVDSAKTILTGKNDQEFLNCFLIPAESADGTVVTFENLGFKDFGNNTELLVDVIKRALGKNSVTLNVKNCSFSTFRKTGIVFSSGILNVDGCAFDTSRLDDHKRTKNAIQFGQKSVATITNSTFKNAASPTDFHAVGILGMSGGQGTVTGNTFTDCQVAIDCDNFYNYDYNGAIQTESTPITTITQKDNTFINCETEFEVSSTKLDPNLAYVTAQGLEKNTQAHFVKDGIKYYYVPYGKDVPANVYSSVAVAVAAVEKTGIRTVSIDSGIHTISTGVTINTSMTIVGVDSAKTILKGDATQVISGFVIPKSADVTIKNLRITETGGSQGSYAFGVVAGVRDTADFATGKLTVMNCTLDSFAKNGIDCNGGTLVATDNFIDVTSFDEKKTAKNGITVGYDCQATITGNTIINSTSKTIWSGSGLLCWTGADMIARGNTLQKCDIGIAQSTLYDDEVAYNKGSLVAYKLGTLNADAESANTFIECTTNVRRTVRDVAEENTLIVSEKDGYRDEDNVLHYYPNRYATLAAAVAAAKAGDTINVKAGKYSVTEPITIDTALAIVGETGAIIEGNDDSGYACFVISSDFTASAVITLKDLVFDKFGGKVAGSVSVIDHKVGAKGVTLNVTNCTFTSFCKNAITARAGILNVDGCTFDATSFDSTKTAKNAIQFEQFCIATIKNSTFKDAQSQTVWSATGIAGLRGGVGTITNNTFTNCQKAIENDNFYNWYYNDKVQDEPTKTVVITQENNTFIDCQFDYSINSIELDSKTAYVTLQDLSTKGTLASFEKDGIQYYFVPFYKTKPANVYSTFADAVAGVINGTDSTTVCVDSGIYTAGADAVVISKPMTIEGIYPDSSNAVIKDIINVTFDGKTDARGVVNFKDLTITSAPVADKGMLDITGSFVTVNTNNVKMINTAALSFGGKDDANVASGIAIKGTDKESVELNFIASEMDMKLAHRGIFAKEGKDHKIKLSNSKIHSNHGDNASTYLYGIRLMTKNSTLDIDQSEIDVNSYAVAAVGADNMTVNIKNSTLTAWSALWLNKITNAQGTEIAPDKAKITVENSKLLGRSYWTGKNDGFAIVRAHAGTNADIKIHNTEIRQILGTQAYRVMHTSGISSGKVALTGTTALYQSTTASGLSGPMIWWPSKTATSTAESTVKFFNADGKLAVEAHKTKDRNSDIIGVTSTISNALHLCDGSNYVFGNDYPKTAVEIAKELTDDTQAGEYDGGTIVNQDYIMDTDSGRARAHFTAGTKSWYLKQTMNDNNAVFEAKEVQIAPIVWALPAHVYYNTQVTALATTTSGKAITYTVAPVDAAKIEANGITFFANCTLTATVATEEEIITNTISKDITVEPAPVALTELALTGVPTEATAYTGEDITKTWTLTVTRNKETLTPNVDYTVVYNLSSGIQATPIDVGTYKATVVLKDNYTYADQTTPLTGTFEIKAKTTTVEDLNITCDTTFVYGTKLSNVAISCDRTKGTIVWDTPTDVPTVAATTAAYSFTATNKNYTSLANQSLKIEVAQRPVQVVVQDSSIAQGTKAFTDSSYVLVNFIKNDVDTYHTVVLESDYSVDSKIGDVARIFVKSSTKTETNQTFSVVEGKLLVGEPTVDAYTYTIASVTYGNTLSNYTIAVNSGKGLVRFKAGQEDLIPTVAGIDVVIEYVLYGKVAETKTVNVKATAKTATIFVDTIMLTVKDASPVLTATVEGALAGEAINYSLSSTYSASNNAPGTFPITVTAGENPNYALTIVNASVVSTQINMTNFIVTPVTTTYNGTAQTAKFNIVYNQQTLVEGTDYTVENATSTQSSQLIAKITFLARYTGTTTGVFDIKPVGLATSIVTTESPYTGEVQKPKFLFKTLAGVVVNFVKDADYNVVDSDLKEIRNADKYVVHAASTTPNITVLNSTDTATFTVLKLNATFTVKNATQTWAEEHCTDKNPKKYQAVVTSNNTLLPKAGFAISYGGDQYDAKNATVTNAGVYQIWAKVTDTNFEWNIKSTSLGFLTLNQVPVPEIFFDKGTSALVKEVQFSEADGAKVTSYDISARIVGNMLTETATARLSLSGSAIEGVNYKFENDKKSFNFTRSDKTDTVRIIILDDGAVTPDLTASFSLIAQTENTKVRAKQASFVLTIETLKDYAEVAKIGFTNKAVENANSSTLSFPYGIEGKDGVTAFVKVSGAKAGDITLRNANGKVIVTESRGYPVVISAGNVGLFTMELVNNDLIKPGANKVITLTLAKLVSNDPVQINKPKASTKLVIRNTSPVAFSDQFSYESIEAEELPTDGYFFRLNVLRNDQPFTSEEIKNPSLFVGGVRHVGAAQFGTEAVDQFGGTLSIDAQGILLYTFDELKTEGYNTSFEYELSQVDAGVSVGTIELTVAPSLVRDQPLAVIIPEATKKPSMYATYLDPNSVKASAKNKLKKITLGTKNNGKTEGKSAYVRGNLAVGSGVDVWVKSNIKAYNSKLLSQTQKAGLFTSSMYNDDNELIYTPVVAPTNVKGAKKVVDNSPKVLQSRKLGLTVMMKNRDTELELSAINMSPALNVKMADSVLSSTGEVVLPNIFVVNKNTNAFTLEGDFFGPSAKFFLEYHDGKQIKKITLPCKRSISYDDARTGMKVTLKRGKVVSGKGQQEWLTMPNSVEKLILKKTAKDARFDLVIDNGSMLTILPNFDVETIINYNRK